MSGSRRRWFLAQAAACALLAGCAARRNDAVTFHDPNMDFSQIRTVAVVPFENLTPAPKAGERVRDVVMTMLQATGSLYVLPPGEVARGLTRLEVPQPEQPTAEQIVALGRLLDADAVVTGSVLEYGEARSGSAAANYITLSLKLLETESGRVVWSASSTKGGVSAADRMFGGGGRPMNDITVAAVDELLAKLFQ